MTIEIRESWPSGPSREWSEERESGSQVHCANGGFAGMYVCQGCGARTVGVYLVGDKWTCADCKEGNRVKNPQPPQLRASADRRRRVIRGV